MLATLPHLPRELHLILSQHIKQGNNQIYHTFSRLFPFHKYPYYSRIDNILQLRAIRHSNTLDQLALVYPCSLLDSTLSISQRCFKRRLEKSHVFMMELLDHDRHPSLHVALMDFCYRRGEFKMALWVYKDLAEKRKIHRHYELFYRARTRLDVTVSGIAAHAALCIKDQASAIQILDTCSTPDHPNLYSYVINAYISQGYHIDHDSESGRFSSRTWGAEPSSLLGKCVERIGHALYSFDTEFNYSLGTNLLYLFMIENFGRAAQVFDSALYHGVRLGMRILF
jgi:hypothetical protein